MYLRLPPGVIMDIQVGEGASPKEWTLWLLVVMLEMAGQLSFYWHGWEVGGINGNGADWWHHVNCREEGGEGTTKRVPA